MTPSLNFSLNYRLIHINGDEIEKLVRDSLRGRDDIEPEIIDNAPIAWELTDKSKLHRITMRYDLIEKKS